MTQEAYPPSDGATVPDAPQSYQPHYHQPSYHRPGALDDEPPGAPGRTDPTRWDAGTAPAQVSAAPVAPDRPLLTPSLPARPHHSGVPTAMEPPHPGGAGRTVVGPVPPPPREAWPVPRRVDTVPGTPFGVVQLDVPPVTAGPAIGSLVAGIASIVVSLLVACFGLVGAEAGWGGWVAGAFAVLAVLLGIAAILLGVFGRRQIRRPVALPGVRFTGRGLALAGVICGAVGLGLTLLALAVALLLQTG